jgi:hypothetical protein
MSSTRHYNIKELTKENKVLITEHAWAVMDKRGISPKEVTTVILTGEIIEEYEDDKPCPSFLMLGFIGSRPGRKRSGSD